MGLSRYQGQVVILSPDPMGPSRDLRKVRSRGRLGVGGRCGAGTGGSVSKRKTDQSSSRLEKSTCGVRSVEENWELDILTVDLN